VSDKAKRDAVMAEFKRPYFGLPDTYALIDEIVRLRDENTAFRAEINRLRRILAALREPSEHGIEWEDPAFPLTVADQEILAAVAAAEREVGHE